IITPEVWDEMKDNPQAQDLRAKITMAWSQDYFQGVPSDIIEKRYEIHLARVYAMLYGAEQSEIECLDHITYCAAFAVEHCAKQHPRITPHE
ncbi:hypothetical protein R2K36_33615, partial [Pseudomonas aeruginosa]|uniref:hypothetical protein n=1 Tax=Pseudomonas aeruginosa TaxID=287 RepID=UPI00396F5D70